MSSLEISQNVINVLCLIRMSWEENCSKIIRMSWTTIRQTRVDDFEMFLIGYNLIRELHELSMETKSDEGNILGK